MAREGGNGLESTFAGLFAKKAGKKASSAFSSGFFAAAGPPPEPKADDDDTASLFKPIQHKLGVHAAGVPTKSKEKKMRKEEAESARVAQAQELALSTAASSGKKRRREGETEVATKEPAETTPVADTVEAEATSKQRTPEEVKERNARTVFIGNVPLNWDEKRLRRSLREAVGDKYEGSMKPLWFRAVPVAEKWSGKLRKAGVILGEFNKQGADSKNAYVVCASPEGAQAVRFAAHGLNADGAHILRADGVGEKAQLQTFDRKRSVFLGNLPTNVTEVNIRECFAKTGEVDAIRIVRDKVSRECKGFAFVRFKERSSVKKALNLWDAEIQGRWIRVMKVEEQEKDVPFKNAEKIPALRRLENKRHQYRRKTSNPRHAAAREAAAFRGTPKNQNKKGKSSKQKFRKDGSVKRKKG